MLEDDPTFDAGTGSFLDEDGRVQLDAAVMEGAGLRAGAVAAVGRFKNPAAIARAVMEKTEHVLLIGEGAERFALAQGFPPVDPRSLVHPREYEGYEAWVRAGKPDARVFFDEEGAAEHGKRGTVGVVIGVRTAGRDRFPLFAGASTGGTRGKKAGRVGDVPLVGCGVYADDEGAAVCCTGWGEAFIRAAAAKSVSDLVAAGAHPQEAVESSPREDPPKDGRPRRHHGNRCRGPHGRRLHDARHGLRRAVLSGASAIESNRTPCLPRRRSATVVTIRSRSFESFTKSSRSDGTMSTGERVNPAIHSS